MTGGRLLGGAVACLLVLSAACTGERGSSGGSSSSARGGPTTTAARTSDTDAVDSAPDLYQAACAGRIRARGSTEVRSPEVTEASGIVASRRRPGWFWIHNDSGDVPRVFGVGPAGQVQVVSVTGAEAIDWEDISTDRTAAGDGLWLADIGDNLVNRPSVVLYRIPEPVAGASSVRAAPLTLVYPDGSHNAEALLRDPADGTLVILAKEPTTARVYSFEPPASGGGRGELRLVGRMAVGDKPGKVVTGADVAADRSMIAVRTYGDLWLYRLRRDQSIAEALHDKPCRAPSAPEVQGEAVGFLPTSRGYVTISEGARPRIAPFEVPH